MAGILAMLFLGTAVSRAGSGGVVDNGAFFSEQAKSDAVKVIAEMERTLRKGMLVDITSRAAPTVRDILERSDAVDYVRSVRGNPLDDLARLGDVRLVMQGGEVRVQHPA